MISLVVVDHHPSFDRDAVLGWCWSASNAQYVCIIGGYVDM